MFRESTRDDDFELLTHRVPLLGFNDRTENLLIRLHEHFGLSGPGELEPSWFDSEPDLAMQNIFVGRIRVFKLDPSHKMRLINPSSLMWNQPVLGEINNDNVSQELVRNTIIDELGTMLLARWRRADIGNALFMEYNYLEQRLIELGSAMDGAASGLVSIVTGIVEIAELLYKAVKASIVFQARMIKASYEFVADLTLDDVRNIGDNLRNLVGEVITTAQQIKDKIILGAKIFNAAMTDGLVREAIAQYMDGYTESVSHVQNINNIANFVGAAVGEILLFIAFAPASLAKLAAQGTVMIGRFSIKLIQLISRLGRAIMQTADDAARAVKQFVEVIPEKLGSSARKADDAGKVLDGNGYTQLELRDAVQLDEFTRLNTEDIGGNAKLRPGEAGAAVEIQNALGGQLRRAEAGEKGDFVFTSGPHQGQSVDFLFTADTNKAAEMMNKFFDKNPSNLTQIKGHVDKADIVPLDMRNLNMENQNKIMDYIHGLSKEDQSKLILIQ